MEQTFIARGTSITGAAMKLAAHKKSRGEVIINVSIHEAANGKQVGPQRKIKAKAIDDLYATFKPGEVPTVPGKTYALRIADLDDNASIGLFVRRDYGFGYPYGQLLIDGKPNGSDGYFYIGSNADDTVLTYAATGNKPAGPPANQWRSQGFVATGTSLGAVCLPLIAEGDLTELTIAVEKQGAKGKPVGVVKKMTPARVKDKENRFLVGVAGPRGEIPLEIGQEYTLAISCGPGEVFSPLAADVRDDPPARGKLAMRIYEYGADKLDYRLPPPPEPVGWEFDETIPLVNAGFERGDQRQWENAWGGGDAFTAIVGADWKADKFSGDAVSPQEGEFCSVIAADHKKVKKLIRRRFSWPHTKDSGVFHARIWVASSDNADKCAKPLTVCLCVSEHGSADAHNVTWSRPVVSPGRWTMLQCHPVVPKGRKQTIFLLVKGGSEDEESYVKVDGLQLIVDEK